MTVTGFDTSTTGIRKAAATYLNCTESFWYNVLSPVTVSSYDEGVDGLIVDLTELAKL